MSAEEAFAQYKAIYNKARGYGSQKLDEETKREAGRLLTVVFTESKVTAEGVAYEARIACLESVERWLRGDSLPQKAQFELLENYLIPQPVSDLRSLAISLNDKRFTELLKLLVAEHEAGREISSELLAKMMRWGSVMYRDRTIPMHWLTVTLEEERG